MKPPVSELVGDREPSSRGPLPGLFGVDPDLAYRREQQSGQRLAAAELGGAGRGPEVLDVAHEQAEVGVGDLLDRHGQRGAVPHVARDAGEEVLGGRSISSISCDGIWRDSPLRPSFTTSVPYARRAPWEALLGCPPSMPCDQLDESPVARLDGVAHERRWVVGV